MLGYMKGREQGAPRGGHRKFLEIELGRFAQIGERFFECFALSGCSRFGIERDKTAFGGGGQYGRQFHGASLERGNVNQRCRYLTGTEG